MDRHDRERRLDRWAAPTTATAAFRRDHHARLAFAGSLLVHLAIFAALMLAVPPRLSKEVGEGGIEVELTVERPPEAVRANPPASPATVPAAPSAAPDAASPSATTEAATAAPPVEPAARAPAEAGPEARAEAGDGLIRAERLLSARRLAEPRNRQAREAMRRFAPEERITQLCDLEAMEQIHARKPTLVPRTVIADALGEATRSPLAIDAAKAAVLDGSHWLRLAFRCEVSPDLGRVTAFAFRLGDELSRAELRRHDLPTDGGDMD